MIIGRLSTQTELEQKLEQLNTLTTPFHSTGSRVFGNAGPDSDWDFFGQYSRANVRELVQIGFRELASNVRYDPSYLDKQTVCVMRCACGTTHIDVQLVKNYALKKRAQECLVMLLPILDLNMLEHKLVRHRVWNRVFDICHSFNSPIY